MIETTLLACESCRASIEASAFDAIAKGWRLELTRAEKGRPVPHWRCPKCAALARAARRARIAGENP